LMRKDGSRVAVFSSCAVFQLPGRKQELFCIDIDLTENKRVEEALYESEQRLRLFIEHAPAALAMFDRNLCYLSASRRWSGDHGLGERDLHGLSIDVGYNIPERWRKAQQRGLAGEVVRVEEDRHQLIDGTVCWMRWEIHPWYSLSGEIGGIVIFTEDISERKRVEEQLQALNNELEQRVEKRTRELQEAQSQYLHAEKLSAIGKLSASIAHEFNNPLQGIMSILKGLKKRAILQEEDRELLDAAIGESVRIKNLIRNLQEFNLPSSGRKVVLDVHESITSLLLLCKSDFKNKRISVVRTFAQSLPRILAVPDQIKQVFLNLLTNAADACQQPGGVITITTWCEQERVAVQIKDSGIGIEPAAMDLIFQPFYTTKPNVKGTGLGLSVCHGIVQHHGGEIRVESRPGEGSAFTVLLPLRGK
jgi:PAS domain S-box-containing protein